MVLKYFKLPLWLDSKESACNVRDMSSIPGLGRSPGGGHGNPHQYSCLENPMDRGAWWATVLQSVGSHESDTTYRLNHHQVLNHVSHIIIISVC